MRAISAISRAMGRHASLSLSLGIELFSEAAGVPVVSVEKPEWGQVGTAQAFQPLSQEHVGCLAKHHPFSLALGN